MSESFERDAEQPAPNGGAEIRSAAELIVERMLADSPLLGRAQLAKVAGLTFAGKRNLYEALGYKEILRFEDYLWRYERGGIARRIVNAYPEDTWKENPVVSETDDDTRETDFEKQFDEVAERLDLFHYLERVDSLSGVGRYAVLFMGVNDGSADFEQPVNPLDGPEDLLYFTVFHEGSAKIHSREKDPGSPRYGLPLFYEIDFDKSRDEQQNTTIGLKEGVRTESIRKVHWSRVLHVAESLAEDEIFGTPRLRAVWNYIDDLEKVVGGSSEAFWTRGDPGYQLDLSPEARMSNVEKDELKGEIEAYIHRLQRFVRTRGVKMNTLASDVPDPRGNFEALVALISATTGIPQRVLLGSEQGRLASTQDRENWADKIARRQRRHAGPRILLPLVRRWIEWEVLPEPDELRADWRASSRLSASEAADVAQKVAQGAATISRQGGGGVVVTPGEYREKWLDLPADLPADAPEPLPPQPPLGGGRGNGNGGQP